MSAPQHIKEMGDVASVATVIGTLAGFLPAIAALFTIIWTALRIWETDTVRGWRGIRGRRRTDRDA